MAAFFVLFVVAETFVCGFLISSVRSLSEEVKTLREFRIDYKTDDWPSVDETEPSDG